MKETVAKATQKQVPNVNSGIRVSMILDRLVNKQDRRRLPLSPCKKKKKVIGSLPYKTFFLPNTENQQNCENKHKSYGRIFAM